MNISVSVAVNRLEQQHKVGVELRLIVLGEVRGPPLRKSLHAPMKRSLVVLAINLLSHVFRRGGHGGPLSVCGTLKSSTARLIC